MARDRRDKLILYTDPGCKPCRDFKPIFNRLVKQNHVPAEIVNVTKCPRDDLTCRTVQFTPTVIHNGVEVPLERLGEKVRELRRRK